MVKANLIPGKIVKRGKKTPKEYNFTLARAIKHLEVMTNQAMTSRTEFLKSLMDPEGRDLDEECGYISDPTVHDYLAFFRRHGIARKVVTVYPDETWATEPDVYVTEKGTHPWEIKWKKLCEQYNIFSELHKFDVNAGIGRCGLLYMGFSDATSKEDLERPIKGMGDDGKRFVNSRVKNDLLFLRPLDESLFTVAEYETNPWSPRCGLPKSYDINFADPVDSLMTTDGENFDGETYRIHWTRVIHLADNTISSPIFGCPRMEPVINWLQDLRKVSGGSAEMFWKGAFPGYSVETHPDIVDAAELDDESVREQFQNYMNGLQRYLAMVGVTVKSLAPQVADPTNHIDTLFRLISATLNTPMRIFTGSEAAHLASSQDGVTWNRRIMRRQKLFVNPHILRPFINRLMAAGVLPFVEQYKIDWQDLNAIAAGEQADVALKKTQAMMQYVSGGVELIMPPTEYFTGILGLSAEQAQMVMKEVSKSKKLTEKFWKQPAPAQGTAGTGGRTGSTGKKGNNGTKKTGKNANGLGSKT